jgi:hypothetical protein
VRSECAATTMTPAPLNNLVVYNGEHKWTSSDVDYSLPTNRAMASVAVYDSSSHPHHYYYYSRHDDSPSWVCWTSGRSQVSHSGHLLDPDHDCKCRDLGRPRPHARHSRSRRLRPLARSGHEGCGFGVRPAEAPRGSADAFLSRKQPDQSRRERRRRMLRASEACPSSALSIRMALFRQPLQNR